MGNAHPTLEFHESKTTAIEVKSTDFELSGKLNYSNSVFGVDANRVVVDVSRARRHTAILF